MDRRDILKVLPLAVAVTPALASPALASGGGSSEGSSGDNAINIAAVALPIIVDGRVVNYVFTTFRLILSGTADMDAVRAKEAWFRDAMVRAAHRRSFAAADSLIALDEAALALAVSRAATVLVGEGAIASVEIVRQIPRRRTGLV